MLEGSLERSQADWQKIQPLGLLTALVAILRVFADRSPLAGTERVLAPFSIAPRVAAPEDTDRLTVAAEVELTRPPPICCAGCNAQKKAAPLSLHESLTQERQASARSRACSQQSR